MKNLQMSLLAVLLLGIFLQHSHSVQGPNLGHDCCASYMKGAIPLSKLVSWSRTSEACRKRAIVFLTVEKKSICANPGAKWVNKAINILSKRASILNSDSSTTTNLTLLNSTQAINSTSALNSSLILQK